MAKTTSRENSEPAILLFVNDWLGSVDLRLCDFNAQGLWMNMLCLMKVSPEYGYLISSNAKQIDSKRLSKILAQPQADVEAGLKQLKNENVYSTTKGNCIYSRRMVRDAKHKASKAQAGRKGGIEAQRKRKASLKPNQTKLNQTKEDAISLYCKHYKERYGRDYIIPDKKKMKAKAAPLESRPLDEIDNRLRGFFALDGKVAEAGHNFGWFITGYNEYDPKPEKKKVDFSTMTEEEKRAHKLKAYDEMR